MRAFTLPRPVASRVFIMAAATLTRRHTVAPFERAPDMRLRRIRLLLPLLLALFALAACGKHEPPATPGGPTPESTVKDSLALLRNGDFATFWKHALPPADYQTLRKDWPRLNPPDEPTTDADRATFAANAHKLTEPDAEARLFAQIRPKLVQYDKEYRDQMPLMVGIFQSMGITAIDQTKELSTAQKQHARDVLAVLAPWAQQVTWGDQAKARQAIAVITDTARKLDLTSPDQLQTMDFDTSMAKYTLAWSGARRLFDVYGLSLDRTFDSVTVEILESDQSSAHVRIHYTLLDKPLSSETTLIQVDGRWYDQELLQSVREAHLKAQPPAAAASAPPPASTNAPAVAATVAAPVKEPINAAPAKAPAKASAKAAAHG
jgi:hypothetical protein